MNREFEHEDFEDFLKRNADGLRMKAPDAVWKKISKDLNKRRRRTIWGVSLALVITSIAGYFAGNIGSDNSPVISAAERNNTKPQVPVVRMSERLNNSVSPSTQASSTTESSSVTLTSRPAPVVSLNGTTSINSSTGIQRQSRFLKRDLERSSIALSDVNTVQPLAMNQQPIFTPTVVDSYTDLDEAEKVTEQKLSINLKTEEPVLPLSIESVTNAYSRKKAKLEAQLYITPTISYRKLSENKAYLKTIDPASLSANFPALTSNVNSNVVHKPDLGFEVGLAVKYPLTERLKLRSGIQFNVNRYEIKAFSSNWTMATIALNSNSGADSLRSLSTYSNVDGYKSNWLQNFSFQVSAPLGIEYNFGGSDKLQLGMAYTVQPTYVLNDRAYIITTDYKRYTQVPWLLRRWNLNTAFETFITYQPGKTRWQLGPQVRYQLLSSFASEYPVKENLFDFGLKLGVSLGK